MSCCIALPTTNQLRVFCRRDASGSFPRFRTAFAGSAVGVVILLSLLLNADAYAQSSTAMRSLDEDVQAVKSDVLAIASELRALEEKLLYPSDTQVAVFVSLSQDGRLELDSVHVRIDDELAASHVYSFKEVEALQKGGVQRIYTGNHPTGEHRIEVAVSGTLSSGGRFEEQVQSTFRKGEGPELVRLTLASKATGGARIEVGGW